MEKCVPLRGIFDDKRSYFSTVSSRTKISKSKRKEAPLSLPFEIGDEAYTRQSDHANGDRPPPLNLEVLSEEQCKKLLQRYLGFLFFTDK